MFRVFRALCSLPHLRSGLSAVVELSVYVTSEAAFHADGDGGIAKTRRARVRLCYSVSPMMSMSS